MHAILLCTAYRLKDNNIMSGAFEGHSRYKDDFVDRGVTKTKRYITSLRLFLLSWLLIR